MTQIICVLTDEYVLVASDNLVTWGSGPKRGQVVSDKECKLVSLCGRNVIGYSGLAVLDGIPTHEWIAKTLTNASCQEPDKAVELLAAKTPGAVLRFPRSLRRHEYLVAGWANLTHAETGVQVRNAPHFGVVSNFMDANGGPTGEASSTFSVRVRSHVGYGIFATRTLGQILSQSRYRAMTRALKNLARRKAGPEAAMRLLVDEIRHTSRYQRTVGMKVMCVCIPKPKAGHSDTGIVGKVGAKNTPWWAYFDPAKDAFVGYGPTYVCGGGAWGNIKTTYDANGEFVSVEATILALPQ